MKSINELINLKDRVAILTGGGGFVGLAIAETLAELGANIVLVDLNQDGLDKNSKVILEKYNIECTNLVIDLAIEEQVKSISEHTFSKYGKIDILINNAAFVGTSKLKGWMVPFEEQSPETWRSALEVNLTAPFVLAQSCSKYLKKSKTSSIINIASIRGMLGVDLRLYENTKMNSSVAYSASKGGLIQLTRYLATVLAPDVRVNSISLGGIFRNQAESFVEKYISNTPLKRMGTEEDVKGAIAYLCSDLSSYVTGHNLVLDGGWVSW